MSLAIFKSLLYKSANIQQKIKLEQQRAAPDYFYLLKMKKLYLYIQDRLQRILTRATTPYRPLVLQTVRIDKGFRKRRPFH